MLESAKVAVAVNCCAMPFATLGFTGEMATAVTALAGSTVSEVRPRKGPKTAKMVTVPRATGLTFPKASIVAIAALELLHFTC